MPIILIVLISAIGSLLLFGVIVSIIFYFNNLNYENSCRDCSLHYLENSYTLLRNRLISLENKVSSYNRFFVFTKKNKIIKTIFSKK